MTENSPLRGHLVFSMNEIRSLYRHAKSCSEHRVSYAQLVDLFGADVRPTDEQYKEAARTVPPTLQFVHDQGVYFMSSGIPPLQNEDKSPYVVYPRGLNPADTEFDVWWGEARQIVGGDDFVEAFDLDAFKFKVEDPRVTTLTMDVYDDRLVLGGSMQKPVASPPADNQTPLENAV